VVADERRCRARLVKTKNACIVYFYSRLSENVLMNGKRKTKEGRRSKT
jgi:hypothetical protein